MNISEPFIRRPIATTLIMGSVAWLGILCYFYLPVSNLPNVNYPSITVTVGFPGASPETMANTVATPLEKEFLTIPGVNTVTSTNTLGNTSVILQFDVNKNVDLVAQDVEAAINRAKRNLPPDLPQDPVYEKVNPSDTPIIYIALSSPTMPQRDLYTLADNYIGKRISTVEGVSQVFTFGSPFAVRIQVNPDIIASLGLSLNDIADSIRNGNPNIPTGVLDGKTQANTIITKGQLQKGSEYQPLITFYKNDRPVRIENLGQAIDSLQNDRRSTIYVDSEKVEKAVVLAVRRQPGANTVQVANEIKRFLPEMAENLPGSVKLQVVFDRSLSIVESVMDVQFTVVIALALVVFIIFLYLGKISDTIIPALILPMSILGTFIIMFLYGFTLDNLSLLGIALAIGFIIDDAIVVLECIVRKVEEGLPPFQAALEGSKQIGFTILSMTISLIAVFIPMLFLGGLVGKIFKEFAIVLTAITAISGIVSLTLTPMLCSRFIRPRDPNKLGGIERVSHWVNDALLKVYKPILRQVLHFRLSVLCVGLFSVIVSAIFFMVLPTDFIPDEDIGFIIAFHKAAEGTSSGRMTEYQSEFIEIIQKNPAVATMVSIAAVTSFREGISFIKLKPRHERKHALEVIKGLYRESGQIVGLQTFFKNLPLIDLSIGPTTQGAYQYTLQSLSTESLYQSAEELMRRMQAEPHMFEGVNSDLEIKTPQVFVELLRDRASSLGVDAIDIEEALLFAYSGNRVSRIQTAVDQYDVILELEKEFQRDPESLNRIYVKNKNNGLMVPLSSVAEWKQGLGPNSVNHISQFPAVTIVFNTPPGIPLGTVLARLKELSNASLLPGTVGNIKGAAETFEQAIEGAAFLLIYSVILIYVVLGVLYEDFIHPITIISTLPPAVLGGLLTLVVLKLPLSLYAYLGIILLVGIVKKNGIMMVDYALDYIRENAETAEKAIYHACIVRFRPIMMTTISMIFGAIPIAFSFGPGAESRRPLGLVIIGGMVLSQLITLFVTPVVFLYLEKAREWLLKRGK